MYLDRYENHEFPHYLNRYLLGIMCLRDKLEKVSLFFELTETFSNHACRLYIDVALFDYKTLSDEEKKQANDFFYNYLNETGSKFVSYIYKPQRGYYIDIKEVELFISHYQFAKSLFEGAIKNILPDQCGLEVEELSSDSFFNYISYFLSHRRYQKDDENFEKQYFQLTKREFEFDCIYHQALTKAANKEMVTSRELIVTDKELYEAGAGEISHLREFVIEKKVPFYLGYNKDVIMEIQINMSTLKDRVKDYVPENSYSVINAAIILKLIHGKEQAEINKNNLIQEMRQKSGVEADDYILIGKAGEEDIGLVKEISLSYNGNLKINYNSLRKDLSEGVAGKSTDYTNVSYVIKSEIFAQELNKGIIKVKSQAIRLFKDRGIKNTNYGLKI